MEYTTFPRFPPTFPHCTVETCGKAVFPSNPVLRIHKFFSFHGLQNPASLVILNLPAPARPRACGRQFARLRRAIRAGGVPPPGLLQFTAPPAPAAPRRAPLARKPALRPCGKTAAQEFVPCACGKQSTRLRQAIRAPAAGNSRRRRPAAGPTANHRAPCSGCASQGSACREARAAALRKNGSAGICFLRRTLKPVCLQPRHRATKIRMCEKSPGFWGNCDYYIILEDKVP